MSWDNKVVWSEGMFLRTQHFQQQDRYVEWLVRSRTENQRPHPWGFASLTLDLGLLRTGRFALVQAAGVFPDGTPFAIPEQADHPLALELPPDTRDAIIYLTLPARQPGGREFDDGERTAAITRYEGADFEARDAVAGAESRAALRVGKLRLRFAVESDDRSGYLSLGVVRVVEVRADKTVVIDDEYIAPCLNCGCQRPLASFAEELVGLLHTRGEALAGRVTQAGASRGGGVAEFADWLLLQAVNRYEPLFAHLAGDSRQLHPEGFFARAVELAGELATFANPRTRRAAQFPPYRHDALQATFAPVIAELRQLLSAILEVTAVRIPLQQRPFGVRVALINDRNLLAFAEFVLAVRAQMPADRLQATFARQVTIGPVETIADLVNRALRGIEVRGLAAAPHQLPFAAGTFYFALDRAGPFFNQMQRPGGSGGLAIYVPQADFPELDLELWAIKSS
ncbi:MAG TPA: type VI secretion system baseplate subunit TssK [Stellaceae bacterium]|nr:type VI secretion system baseplate subunit TssK [Stellaceae bacterium]